MPGRAQIARDVARETLTEGGGVAGADDGDDVALRKVSMSPRAVTSGGGASRAASAGGIVWFAVQARILAPHFSVSVELAIDLVERGQHDGTRLGRFARQRRQRADGAFRVAITFKQRPERHRADRSGTDQAQARHAFRIAQGGWGGPVIGFDRRSKRVWAAFRQCDPRSFERRHAHGFRRRDVRRGGCRRDGHFRGDVVHGDVDHEQPRNSRH